MMPYELFIGLRYLRAKRKQTFISIISLISIGGVALGVMALIIVLAVMNGFEGDLRDKILGTNSHVVILKHGRGTIAEYPQIIAKLKGLNHVVASAPFIYGQVMLSSETNVFGVVLRGIEPGDESAVTDLKKNMLEGSLPALAGAYGKNHVPGDDPLQGVVIGLELSRNLGAFMGDEINAISPTGNLTPMGLAPKVQKLKIVGVFASGMFEYDSSLAYVSLKTAQTFFGLGDTVTGVEIRTDDIYQAAALAERIQHKLGFPYWTRDWMEMNQNLFSALKLEKLAMFIILTLIVVVAAFNIISTLIMMVMEKTSDIAILKSMGANSRSIMAIFMLEGLIIGVLGTIIGGASGAVICHLADKYHWIKLAGDVYYMSSLPFKMNPLDVILICSASILISFLATIYPAWQAARLDPAVSLRYE